MKRLLPKTLGSKPIAVCWVLLFFAAATRLASAAALQEARVSQVIQDVRLLEAHAAPRRAVVNDKVTLERAVRTGVQSRAELTFTDLTITRLGANTIFSLQAGAREVNLTSGTILLEVPAKAAPVKASTASVTVAVMGGTALFGTGPPTKFMVLEGIGSFYPTGHPEKTVTLHGGEMMMMTADRRITKPEKFDVKLVLATSALIVDFPPLTNLPLILAVVNQQLAAQSATTSNPIPSKSVLNVIDVTDQNTTANPVVLASTSTPTPSPPPPTPTPTPPPPTPTPTPSKFGTPVPISSPNPYVITSGTVITTDPTITTNGVTDFGKIYRDPAQDGPFPTYLFGSTSAFDNTIKFGNNINPSDLPIAVFKFQSLSLVGNPTIDLGVGGTTKLGLVAIDGITTGPPGGTLTFTGLDLLGLITQAGSIDLTSDVSFQNIGLLFIYARGTGSNLTLAAPILGSDSVQLTAQGSMQLMIGITAAQRLKFITGSDLVTTGPGGSAQFEVDNIGGTIAGTSGDRSGNITLMVGGNLSSQTLSFLLANNAGGSIGGTGGNIDVTTGGNFTSTGDATFTIQNTTGTINNGGNITFTAGGSSSTAGVFSLLVENYDFSGNTPGHIGTGGNISVTTGGDLSAQSVIGLINNRSGGQIDSPVSLTLSIGGALNTSGESTDPFGFPESLSLTISTRFDSTSGSPALASTIGGDATLAINAVSASIGGGLSTVISNSGGTLNGSALLSLGVTDDVSIRGEADMNILNDADSASPLGGRLHGSATLQLSSNNFTANALFADIDNRDAAVIDSNAALIFDLKGSFAIPGTNPGNPNFDATVPGEADIFIRNQKRGLSQDSATTGGTIGGNALIQLTAASVSTAGLLDVEIQNNNGGHIGGNATINLHAAKLAANSLTAEINNSNGGAIGGNAAINMNLSGTATVTNDATTQILGSDPTGSAAINFNGGSYAVGGTFLSSIDNDGTITFNNASAHANVLQVGALGTNGVLNIGGGMLSAHTTLKLYAPGSNGQLNFVANVTLGGTAAKILAANSVSIFNGVVVTIGGSTPADVYTNNANYTGFGGNGSTTGTFAGAGANSPQPLSSAPAFSDPPATPTSSTKSTSTKTTGGSFNVSNSGQLLSLLDGASVGPDGKIMVSGVQGTSNLKNLSGTNINGLSRADRRMLIQQMRDDRDTTRVGGKRIL